MNDAKADLFAILDAVPDGVEHLRKAIFEGRIHPMYPNVSLALRVGCIKAHLAEFKKCDSFDLPSAARFIWRGKTIQNHKYDISPVEKYISHIRWPEKPEKSEVLRTILRWIDEWKAAREFEVEEERIEEDF